MAVDRRFAGQAFENDVLGDNRTAIPLSGYPLHAVSMSYHWSDRNHEYLETNGMRIPLLLTVAPGGLP